MNLNVCNCPAGNNFFHTLATRNTCTACITNCRICTNTSQCTECLGNYIVNVGNTCSLCPVSKFKTGVNICGNCPANCISCTNGTSCITCAATYTWNPTITQCAVPPTCLSGTYLTGHTCSGCISNCSVCSNGSSCSTC
jgi:proprotein convertase subtilisin/kexin type 5